MGGIEVGLFKLGRFALHSGGVSAFKIDCDYLDDEDIETLAHMIRAKFPPWGEVEGVPQGGLRLAAALTSACVRGHSLLIVDDVLTSGKSMEEHRRGRAAMGAVIFARGRCPDWVEPIFVLGGY